MLELESSCGLLRNASNRWVNRTTHALRCHVLCSVVLERLASMRAHANLRARVTIVRKLGAELHLELMMLLIHKLPVESKVAITLLSELLLRSFHLLAVLNCLLNVWDGNRWAVDNHVDHLVDRE